MEDKLYNYLINNCVGFGNRIKSNKLMKIFNINDNKTFRKVIENLRQRPDTLFICSESGKDGGYFIANNEEECKNTLDHFYKRSFEMLKTYSILRKKAQANNQYVIKQDYIELYNSILNTK